MWHTLGDLNGFESAFETVAKGISPIIEGVGARIGGSNYRPNTTYQSPEQIAAAIAAARAQQGASVDLTNRGLTGKIDSTTLLLIAGVAAIFLLKR